MTQLILKKDECKDIKYIDEETFSVFEKQIYAFKNGKHGDVCILRKMPRPQFEEKLYGFVNLAHLVKFNSATDYSFLATSPEESILKALRVNKDVHTFYGTDDFIKWLCEQ